MSCAVCARLALPNGLVGANVLAVETVVLDTVTMVARAGLPNRKQTLMGFVRTVTKGGRARYAV